MASPDGVAGALAGVSEPDPPVVCKPSELLAGAHAASFCAGLVGDSVSCGDALAFAAIAGRGKKLHLAKKNQGFMVRVPEPRFGIDL